MNIDKDLKNNYLECGPLRICVREMFHEKRRKDKVCQWWNLTRASTQSS